MSRANVNKHLGKPVWSLEKKPESGIDNSADKWYDEIGNGIRVEYTIDEASIHLITVQSKKQEDKFK